MRVACHLGRNPTKIEALEALGLGSSPMLGFSVMFGTSSDSAQSILNRPKTPATGAHAVRSISASFSEGATFGELCEKLHATTTTPASDAVFKSLAEKALDGGQDSCNVCHDKLRS